MMNNMNSYFVAEKQESVIFIAVGLLALGISVWLWVNGHRLKSMAYPLVVIGLMQIVVGGTVYLRTDSQVSTLSALMQLNPSGLFAAGKRFVVLSRANHHCSGRTTGH